MKYKHDFRAFNRLVLSSPEMLADMGARAKRGHAEAERISPHETGEYAASFVSGSEIRKGPGAHRAIGFLNNTSDHAAFVEYGADDTPAYHVLARALNAMGD
jgi:hypothetical protein